MNAMEKHLKDLLRDDSPLFKYLMKRTKKDLVTWVIKNSTIDLRKPLMEQKEK